MPLLNYPDGTIVVVPNLYRAWVCIVRSHPGVGALVAATNADDLLEEAAAFLRTVGLTDLGGGPYGFARPRSLRRRYSPTSIRGRFETACSVLVVKRAALEPRSAPFVSYSRAGRDNKER